MSHYDAANTGHNPDASGPKTEVKTAWRYRSCTGASSGIVVSNGQVYTGGITLDGRTGENLHGDRNPQSTDPTVANGTVYYTGYGLEASGANQWSFQPDGNKGIFPTPVVSNKTVYVPGSNSTLYAVNANSGTKKWEFETDGRIETTPAVLNSVVYIVDKTNTLYAVSADTGEKRWQVSQGTECWRCPPAVANDRVFLGSWDGEIRAIHTADGTTAWQRTDGIKFRIRGPVAVTEQIVLATGDRGEVIALDATTGQTKWLRDTNTANLASPVIVDDVVYVSDSPKSTTGKIFAFTAADGEELWRFETREISFGDHDQAGTFGPVVVDGAVYVSTTGREVYALIE